MVVCGTWNSSKAVPLKISTVRLQALFSQYIERILIYLAVEKKVDQKWPLVFMEVETRYVTELNCAITQEGRMTFVVSALKG